MAVWSNVGLVGFCDVSAGPGREPCKGCDVVDHEPPRNVWAPRLADPCNACVRVHKKHRGLRQDISVHVLCTCLQQIDGKRFSLRMTS
jgi:hypothetical protein